MTVELRPLGVKCNIACRYCYQQPMREAKNTGRSYDLDAMKSAVLSAGGPFTLFGGEPLLLPMADLKDLLEWGYTNFGGSTIQTNGVLIEKEHVDLFKACNVQVGISLDGPARLNAPRWAGSIERTNRATEKVERTLETLIQNGIAPGLITTLHRANAAAGPLPLLLDWFRYLDRIGIPSARIHLLEIDARDVRDTLALSPAENVHALLKLAELQSELRSLKLDVFSDIRGLLLAEDSEAACVWRACDPYTTPAVQGIEGHGQQSNCGRTNKAGVDFLKSEVTSFERYLALFHTPQEFGGCKGCRFFLACKGQCPGTAIYGDWRNRSEHCETWFEIFRVIEARLLDEGYLPISADPNRQYLETEMLRAWEGGANPTLHATLQAMIAANSMEQGGR